MDPQSTTPVSTATLIRKALLLCCELFPSNIHWHLAAGPAMPQTSRLFSLAILLVVLAFCAQSTAFTRHLPSLFKDFQTYLQVPQSFFQPQPNPPDEDAQTAKGYLRKIVAVGDLHGDMPNALKVLQMAHVVDANGDWSGEIDFFVQTGDIVDR